MNIRTRYLGLDLRSPLVPSASPLTEDISHLQRMEECGAGAVVLTSLFEEQLVSERLRLHHHIEEAANSFSEAQSYFPEPSEYALGPDEHLERIRLAKEKLEIPVIASLNGVSVGGWTAHAKLMQEAGADALELNVYYIPTDTEMSSEKVEQTYVDVLEAVKSTVTIPVAMKLSPFFSNTAYMARRLADAGADGLVLFNRFYQPDIDLEELEVKPSISLSQPGAITLPLRWIAILHGKVDCSLAATSGVHRATDAIKLLMAGADVTQVCAALLKNGIGHLRTMHEELEAWLTENEYESVEMLQGSMSQRSSADPSAFERAQYMRALQTFFRE
jgi:dihydroorotate dehydrogenase (fumarate)